jgi:hypothetical protein
MDIQVRPHKKRKTRRDRPFLEGDTEASDAVTVEHVEVNTRRGTVVKVVLVPLDPSEAENPEDRPLSLGGFTITQLWPNLGPNFNPNLTQSWDSSWA